MHSDSLCVFCRNAPSSYICEHFYPPSSALSKRKHSPLPLRSKRIKPSSPQNIFKIYRTRYYYSSLSLSSDASFLVTACTDHKLRIWNIPKKQVLKVSQKFESDISCLCISKNDIYILIGCEYRIYVLDTLLTVLFYLQGHYSFISSIVITTDNRYILSASFDRTIRIWSFNAKSQQFSFTGHTKRIECISLSSDYKYLASGSADKTLRLWNLLRNSLEAVLNDAAHEIYSVSFSNDNRYLISGSNTIRVYSVKTKNLVYKLEGDYINRSEYIYYVRMTADNRSIYFKSYYENIHVCRLDDRLNSKQILNETGNLYCIDLNESKDVIAYARYDNYRSTLNVCRMSI